MPTGIYIRTKEMKESMRRGQLGYKQTPEHINKRIQKLKGKKATPEAKKNLSISQIERFKNPKEIQKTSDGQKKRFENPLEREKISIGQLKRYSNINEIEKNRQIQIIVKNKPEQKEKHRKIRIKQIEQNYGICIPSYNLSACEYFKKFDEEHNTKGRYAVYGNGEYYISELGYFVDYINFDLKLIIEWDEEKHYNKDGTLKHKDIIRQQEIQEHFSNFEFKRIKENIGLKEQNNFEQI